MISRNLDAMRTIHTVRFALSLGRIMVLLTLNPKAEANKKGKGYEYHKEKVSALTGPTGPTGPTGLSHRD